MRAFDVTLAGECNLDLLLHGLPEDLPTDRELLADSMALAPGGSPAITAHNLAALGSRTGFVTVRTSDSFGRFCMEELASAGVDLSHAVSAPPTARTGVSVLLEHEHSRRTLTWAGAAHNLSYEDLDLDYLASARHFHLSSYFLQERLRGDVPKLFAHLKRAGLTISLDPNDDPRNEWGTDFLEVLRHVDVLMPNEREACAITREADPAAALRQLAEQVPLLIVKQGVRGATAFHRGKSFHSGAYPVSPVDAVGAGDSFNAGFLHAYLQGAGIEESLRMGNLAGAFSTTAAGGIAALHVRGAFERFASAHTL